MGKKHDEIIEHLLIHPEEIEEGVKLYYRELGFGKGRVDLIGVDKDGNLCIVEVKIRRPNREKLGKQLQNYYSPIKLLFGVMGIDKKIRMFLATPKGVEHLYDIKPFKHEYIGRRGAIPTARELYGGQVEREWGRLPQRARGRRV